MSTSAIFQHLSTLIEVSKPTFSGLMHISLSLFTADSPKNGISPLPVDLVVTEAWESGWHSALGPNSSFPENGEGFLPNTTPLSFRMWI